MSKSLINIKNISKSYGEKILFENLNFSINEGNKVALIAHNGAGKTTLLNILCKKEWPDEGEVNYRESLKIAYLRQNEIYDKSQKINEYLGNLNNSFVRATDEYYKQLDNYQNLASKQNQMALDKAISTMDQLEAWEYAKKIKEVLDQLKITNMDSKLSELSGGQLKKIALASVIIEKADILILDEPTNHLDIETIEWLEKHLKKQKLSLFLVTHDRYFLDEVCNTILEIDQQTIFSYSGNYSNYIKRKAEKISQITQETLKAKNLYKTELDWMRRQPKARTSKSKSRISSFYELEKKAKARLDNKQIDFKAKMSRQGGKILEIKRIYKSFDSLKIVSNFSYTFKKGEKVGLVGPNGSGKSTFLNLISKTIQADSGEVNMGETTKMAYFTQKGLEHKDDHKVIDIVKEIAESIIIDDNAIGVAQFLYNFGFSYNLQQNYFKNLSGGERRKLHLVTTLLKNPNFLILDEPTNDLDLFTLNRLEEFLYNFKGCLVIASHDRYFMDKLCDHMFIFHSNGEIKDFIGNYSDYRELLDNQERKLKQDKKTIKPPKKTNKPKNNFSYKDQKELEKIETELQLYEKEKLALLEKLNSGQLSTNELHEKSVLYKNVCENLEKVEHRWLELSEKKEKNS
jgi:ATP-binding cassette subfamily F protein uup